MCTKLLKNWQKRNLTFFGKITVIKTLIMPKFVYLVQSLVVPPYVIKTIDSLIYSFLWSGKKEKIKRLTLIGNKLKGGIEMCDTNSFFISLKINWIKKLTDNQQANWKVIPEYFLKEFGNNFLIFYMNTDTLKDVPNIQNIKPFYKDILKC